jgi:hypothetical protein
MNPRFKTRVTLALSLSPLFFSLVWAAYDANGFVLVNNDDGAPYYVEEVGTWESTPVAATCPGITNPTSRYTIMPSNPGARATFTPDIPITGDYCIEVAGPATSSAGDHVLFEIHPWGAIYDSVWIDQRTDNPCDWKLLGIYHLARGMVNSVSVVNDGTSFGYVIRTDLMKFTCLSDEYPPEPIDDLGAYLHGGSKSNWGNVYLSWTEPFDSVGVAQYVIYRSTEPYQLGDSLSMTTKTSYLDIQVVGNPSINFFYTIKAVDGAGNKSDASNQVGEFDRPCKVK